MSEQHQPDCAIQKHNNHQCGARHTDHPLSWHPCTCQPAPECDKRCAEYDSPTVTHFHVLVAHQPEKEKCCDKCIIWNSPSMKDYSMGCSDKSCSCHTPKAEDWIKVKHNNICIENGKCLCTTEERKRNAKRDIRENTISLEAEEWKEVFDRKWLSWTWNSGDESSKEFIENFIRSAISAAVEKERERIGKWDVESAKEVEEMVGRTRIEERARILELLPEGDDCNCGYCNCEDEIIKAGAKCKHEEYCKGYNQALEDVRKKLSENP